MMMMMMMLLLLSELKSLTPNDDDDVHFMNEPKNPSQHMQASYIEEF